MYEHVLFATDGSDAADAAVEHAVETATAHDATLHVLSVAEEAVAETADAATADGVHVERVVRDGVPYREIQDYAHETGVDLIIVGTHGLEGREKRVNMGSTAERVVNKADRPVLVVR